MPVMVRRATPAAKKKPAGGKSKAGGIQAEAPNGFITPDSITSTRMDHESLLGVMPLESDCLLRRVAFKVNHLCEWTTQLLALTKDALCFTVDGDPNMRDMIPLDEVRPPARVPPPSNSSELAPVPTLRNCPRPPKPQSARKKRCSQGDGDGRKAALDGLRDRASAGHLRLEAGPRAGHGRVAGAGGDGGGVEPGRAAGTGRHAVPYYTILLTIRI